MLLKDKTVVIFGGSGAIGRAAALAQIAGLTVGGGDDRHGG
ncbi:hypothetical protein [Klebsiella aerogenes]|nr:hypothetical protein [Klebsiella aerogenes]